MKPKIFITPWRDLLDDEIQICFAAGADSARIHTGKLNQEQINSLINFYVRNKYKFYLDLTGNKPRVNSFKHFGAKTMFSTGESVIIYTKHSSLPNLKRDHDLEIDFFPCILKSKVKGDLNVDDGRLAFNIVEVVMHDGKINYLIANVAKSDQHYAEYKDGVSSSNINIHSHENNVLIRADVEFLLGINSDLQKKVKYIVLSFCERPDQIKSTISLIDKLGFKDFQIVPKIETIVAVKNIEAICKYLVKLYGDKAEIQIGRGDLSQDCSRGKIKYDLNSEVDKIIDCAHLNNIQVSVLALILQSSRLKFRANRKTEDLTPSEEDVKYIQHLCDKKVMQIGLTSETYIDHPERMIKILKEIVSNFQ